MREIRPSGSEGGVALTPPSLPLSCLVPFAGGTPRLGYSLAERAKQRHA
jgi:hypothetical protein